MSSFGNIQIGISFPTHTIRLQPHLGLDFEIISSSHAFIALLRAGEDKMMVIGRGIIIFSLQNRMISQRGKIFHSYSVCSTYV